jgi:hypothetical protein
LARTVETAAADHRAREVTRRVAFEAERQARKILAGEAARADDLSLLEVLNTPFRREYLFVAVAGALAAVGESAAAENLLPEITDPFQKVRALMAVSAYTEPPQARRLLAQALSSGEWAVCLDQLQRHDPAAVSAVADQILAQRPAE